MVEAASAADQQRRAIERVARLTPLQSGMLFEALRMRDPAEAIYSYCLGINGDLEPSRLQAAWEAAVARHDMLRTSFHYENLDTPVQVVRRVVELPWEVLDWSGVSGDEVEVRLEALVVAERTAGFELSRAPLLRLVLVRLGGGRWWLVWTFHHLLLDGWSIGLVLSEVFGGYSRSSSGPVGERSSVRPFWEFVAWLSSRDLVAAERFWRERLAGWSAPTALPLAGGGRGGAGFGECRIVVPVAVRAGLEELARSWRVTLGALVHAAWGLVLSRLTGASEVVFGTVVSGRPAEFAGVAEMVGLFINVLPVRVMVDASVPVGEWVAGVQRGLVEAREFENTPLVDIQRWSELPAGTPLFNTLLAFLNYPIDPSWAGGDEYRVTELRPVQQPHYPLHLTVRGDEELALNLGFDAEHYDNATARRLVDLLADALATLSEDVHATVGSVLYRTDVVSTARLHSGAGLAAPILALKDAVAWYAAVHPDLPAVVSDHAAYTYREVDEAAAVLASEVPSSVRGHAVAVDAATAVDRLVAAVALGRREAVAVLKGELSGDVALSGMLTASGGNGDLGFQTHLPATASVFGSGAGVATVVATASGPVAVSGDEVVACAHALRDVFDLRAGDRVSHFPYSGSWLVDLTWIASAGAAIVESEDPVGRVWRGRSATPATKVISIDAMTGIEPAADLVVTIPGDGPTYGLALWDARTGSLTETPRVGRLLHHSRALPRLRVDEPILPWHVEAVVAAMAMTEDVEAVQHEQGFALHVGRGAGHPLRESDIRDVVRLALPGVVIESIVLRDHTSPNATDAMDVGAGGAYPLPLPVERRDPMQAAVLSIWTQLLGPDATDLHQDFFLAGGHSLMAIRLVSRIRSLFGAEFKLTDLFAAPTVSGITEWLRTSSGGAASSQIPAVSRETPLPVSYSQERLWFLDVRDGPSPLYNVPLAARLRGAVDLAALDAALDVVVARHEALRTSLREDDGVPVQIIEPHLSVSFERSDLTDLPAADAFATALELLAADSMISFDLTTAPLFRARLIAVEREDFVLGFCVHHAVFDGWSTAVFVTELEEAYHAYLNRRAPRLPPLRVQFGDYSAWQREQASLPRQLEHMNFWREFLRDLPSVLDVADVLPDTKASQMGERFSTVIAEEAMTAFRETARSCGVTLFTALLGCFNTAVARAAARSDVVVATPVAGRDHPDVEPLIGFFVNMIVIRSAVDMTLPFRDYVVELQRACLAAFTHSGVPFEQLVSDLCRERQPRRAPLAQVAFGLQNEPSAALRLQDVVVDPIDVNFRAARFDVHLDLEDYGGPIKVNVDYRADLYDRRAVEALVADFMMCVEDVSRNPGTTLGDIGAAIRHADG